MKILGTHCFVSKKAAIHYYLPYCNEDWPCSKEHVNELLKKNAIRIGKPEIKQGESLCFLDNGLRYGIRTHN